MSHWIWTIFNEILLWIDKSDFMQEESPGFQLTGGSRCRSITKRSEGKRGERKKGREEKMGKKEEGERKAFN